MERGFLVVLIIVLSLVAIISSLETSRYKDTQWYELLAKKGLIVYVPNKNGDPIPVFKCDLTSQILERVK